MVRQTLPITHFEKWLPIINALDPDFWKRNTSVTDPLIKYYKTRKSVVSANSPKAKPMIEYLRMCKAVLEDVISNVSTGKEELSKFGQELEAKGVDLARLKNDKDKDKKLYIKEVLDYLYTCRIGGTVDSNGELDLKLDSAEWSQNDFTSAMLAKMFKSFYYFNRYGRKQFRIEEQLTAELLLTGVQGVYASFLKLPYPAFSITIPHNKLLTIRRRLVNQAYINEVYSINGPVVKRKINISFIFAENHIDHISFLLDDNKNLLEQVEEQIKGKYQSELALRETREIMSFLLSTILYMNSKDAIKQDITPSVIVKTNSKFPCCALGYGIPINKSLHITRDNYKSDRTVNVLKYTVRGHFRTYTKGEHWKQDSVIWIKPFLKGSEKDNVEMPIKPTNYNIK